MNLIQFTGALETGLIYSFVALGVYLSFRTLQFPDLTVDGSFPLGAAVCAALIVIGVHPGLATLAAILAGSLAGFITAFMATRLKMLNLLAGIITMTALYSVNLRVMGRPNVALLGEETIISKTLDALPFLETLLGDYKLLFLLSLLALIVYGILYFFLSSQKGLAVRATGNNPRMARAQGISDQRMVWIGLALSNGLVALGGALFAQVNGFADVTLGVGTIIIGLAAVIIGETLFSTRRIFQALAVTILGAILYRLVIAFALNIGEIGLKASDLNMVTALIVALAMVLPTLKTQMKK